MDELNANNLQDATLLYDDPKVYGPTSRTDARHSGTLAAVFMVKGFTIAPFYIFRSPLPVSITEGLDTNVNGERNDIPAKAYQFTDIGEAPKEIGELRDLQLRPWRVAHAVQPPRLEGLPPGGQRAHRSDCGDLQPVQREQPDRLRRHAAARHGRGEHDLHAAQQLLG